MRHAPDNARIPIGRKTSTAVFRVIADALPSATRRLSRKIHFVVEQVAGAVFRTRELPYLHTHVVEERATREPVIWIERPTQPIHDQVRPLVDALFLDDERFLAMDPTGERLAERWALVTVKDGVVEGLPSRAPKTLVEEIERAARAAPKSPEERPTVRSLVVQPLPSDAIPKTHRTSFTTADLVLGGDDHREAILKSLRRARHRVIIHSTFINEQRFQDLLPAFRTAMGQGATIDILWGQDDDAKGVRATREVVGRLQKKLEVEKIDRLRLHPFSTGSHSKVLISDDGDPDGLTAYVGSCNWLQASFASFDASVRIRDARLISDLFDQLAEMSRGSNGDWLALTSDFVAMAARQRSRPIPAAGRANVTLLLAPQHAEMIRRARDQATARIFVASHRWGIAGQNVALAPILKAAQEHDIAVSAYYGTSSGPLTGIDAAEATWEASQAGVTIRPVHKPILHAKFLGWDDDNVVITSQNWLSADPPEGRPRQEMGLLINAPGAARILIERFQAARLD